MSLNSGGTPAEQPACHRDDSREGDENRRDWSPRRNERQSPAGQLEREGRQDSQSGTESGPEPADQQRLLERDVTSDARSGAE